MNTLLDKNIDELKNLLSEIKQPQYRATQIKSWLNKGVRFEEMSNLPISLRKTLREQFDEGFIECIETKNSKDGSIKYLFKLADGNTVESVYLPKNYGNSVCLSTQVGCAMGCKFCASCQDGLIRNLSAAEILAQIIYIKSLDLNVNHIVLMGMGEPLQNYQNVIKFLELVTSEEGLNIGIRNISLSTCGIVENIDKLAHDKPGITLSISLHAPTQKQREQIMPAAKKYDISEVIRSAKDYFELTGRRVIFEYILIKGFNDSKEDAENLVALIKGFPAHVNIIPMNKWSDLKSPTLKETHAFCETLKTLGVSASVRKSMGSDIDGACGQLRSRYIKNIKD